jgi:hypothetical protein
MAKSTTGPRERVVIGLLLMASALLGVSGVAGSDLQAASRLIEQDLQFAFVTLALAAVTYVWCVAYALVAFGGLEGMRLLGREGWPGLLFGAGLGFLTGFALRAILPGAAAWVGLALYYLGGLCLIVVMAQRGEPERWEGRSLGAFASAAWEYLVPRHAG